jgi:hypothetical protein
MTDTQHVAVQDDLEVERPHLLVLHLRPEQDPGGGAHDPVPDQAIEFFRCAVKAAADLRGLREITLDLPDARDEARRFLDLVGAVTVESGFDLRALACVEHVADWGASAFSACREVALRVDARRFPGLRLPSRVYDAVGLLQAESRVVNLSVMLDRELLRHLTLPRLRRWLDRADFVTLVAPRRLPMDTSRSELSAFFDRLAPLWEKADRFFHLQVDRSIKPAFFPWNLLSVTCPASDLAVHVEADGTLYLCAAPAAFATLAQADQLSRVVEEHLEKTRTLTDLCVGSPLPPR